MPDYDSSEEIEFIVSLDAKNLYGLGISKYSLRYI